MRQEFPDPLEVFWRRLLNGVGIGDLTGDDVGASKIKFDHGQAGLRKLNGFRRLQRSFKWPQVY